MVENEQKSLTDQAEFLSDYDLFIYEIKNENLDIVDISPFISDILASTYGDDIEALFKHLNYLYQEVAYLFDTDTGVVFENLYYIYHLVEEKIYTEIDKEELLDIITTIFHTQAKNFFGIYFNENTTIFQIANIFKALKLIKDLDQEELENVYYILEDENYDEINRIITVVNYIADFFNIPKLMEQDDEVVYIDDIMPMRYNFILTKIQDTLTIYQYSNTDEHDEMILSILQQDLKDNKFIYFDQILMKEPFSDATDPHMLSYLLNQFLNKHLGDHPDIDQTLGIRILRAVISAVMTFALTKDRETKEEPIFYTEYIELIRSLFRNYLEVFEKERLGEHILEEISNPEYNYFERTYNIVRRAYEKYRVFYKSNRTRTYL